MNELSKNKLYDFGGIRTRDPVITTPMDLATELTM